MAACAVVALLLEITVRDAVPYLATLWYAGRPAVLAGALVLAGGAAFLAERFAPALGCGFLLIEAVSVHLERDVVRGTGAADEAPPRALTGLLWNVQGGRRCWTAIAETVARHDPDVVCLVEPLRTDWRHAFETAGRGPDATWPDIAPVLSLDHVWASRGVRVHACRLLPTSASDHLPVLFRFSVADAR